MDHKVVCEKWVELACACNGLEICNIFEGLLDRMGLESRLETRLFEETVGRERKVAGADFTRALSKSLRRDAVTHSLFRPRLTLVKFGLSTRVNPWPLKLDPVPLAPSR